MRELAALLVGLGGLFLLMGGNEEKGPVPPGSKPSKEDLDTIKKVEKGFLPSARQMIVDAGYTPRQAFLVIPFMRDIVALYYAMIDKETDLSARISIAAALIYVVSPVDLIPDTVPVVGWIDDAGALGVLISLSQIVTEDRHYAAADAWASAK